MTSLDLANAESLPLRVLWRVRDRLGSWFGLGRISAPIDSDSDDAAGKLPIPAADVDFGSTPFAPLWCRADRRAAGRSVRSPRGLFGKGYMALIKPFRYWVVYPAMMRQIERAWNARAPR